MKDILDEIEYLRHGKPFIIDEKNSNQYRLVVMEDDGSKTAYCFSTPIYHDRTKKLLDLEFVSGTGERYFAVGSNANITVSDHIRLENEEGYCKIELAHRPTENHGDLLLCGTDMLMPTTNGVALRAELQQKCRLSFVLEVEQPFLEVRENGKYFALMQERFRPFAVVSCIGALDKQGQLIAPASMEYQKLTDRTYRVTVTSTSPLGTHVLIEASLYAPKLLQDTTVESVHPTVNNAFGPIAFVGYTEAYGEQWLYTRLEYSKIADLMDKFIHRVRLHLPKLDHSDMSLAAYQVASRFCSFGSNWNNKVAAGSYMCMSEVSECYQTFDLTAMIVDPQARTLRRTEGVIIKPRVRGAGLAAIATGDSYYAPQIMEFHYC